MTRLAPTNTVVKIIWGKAGERCCICRQPLSRVSVTGGLFTIGKIAHICAAESGGPRFDTTKTDEELRSYPNLMLVCGNHHDEIDNDVTRYTVEVLCEIKATHELWVEQQLAEVMPTVGYPDLEVAIKYLENGEVSEHAEDYSLTEIKAKIDKNDLTPATERVIQMGLTQVTTIASYLNQFPDPSYGDRLKELFVTKYNQARESDLTGDALFYEMITFVAGEGNDMKRYAAAVALTTYFFERCDIFEK